MDIKVGRASLLFISFFGIASFQCLSRAAETEPSMGQQSVSPLSRQVARISIQPTTLLDALLQIGQSSHQCFGIVLVQRSAASAEIPSINAESITVGDLLARLLENTKEVNVKEEKGCIIIAPVANAPRYLKTVIPSFRTERSPIELQSYYLSQALAATAPQPPHQGAWGTISSISAATDSPKVGPMDLKGLSVEIILCRIAKEAGSTMWVAMPKKGDTGEPWRFIWYTEARGVINVKLRSITESLPD